MKQIMTFAFSLLLATGASVSAQEVVNVAKDSTISSVRTSKAEPFNSEMKIPADSTKNTGNTPKTTEPVKTEMNSTDLPQPVKDLGTSFKSQGWDTADKAYVVKEASGNIVFYVVTFKNTKSGESKSINIDAKGNIVKE